MCGNSILHVQLDIPFAYVKAQAVLLPYEGGPSKPDAQLLMIVMKFQERHY